MYMYIRLDHVRDEPGQGGRGGVAQRREGRREEEGGVRGHPHVAQARGRAAAVAEDQEASQPQQPLQRLDQREVHRQGEEHDPGADGRQAPHGEAKPLLQEEEEDCPAARLGGLPRHAEQQQLPAPGAPEGRPDGAEAAREALPAGAQGAA